MKINLLFIAIALIFSCTKGQYKDRVVISGKIKNSTDSIISISSNRGLIKEITISKDGSFKGMFKVPNASIYYFQTKTSSYRVPLFLKNGFDINIKADIMKPLSNFKFLGTGASNTSFIIAQLELSNNFGYPESMLKLNQDEFNIKNNLLNKKYDSILNSYDDLDNGLLTMANQKRQDIKMFYKVYSNSKLTSKGEDSPKFVNFMDFKSGKKSLNSFKGQYVYIDVWATWCGPCIIEIPYLKKLEKEFHNKNIKFVSISIDNNTRSNGSWEVAEKKWRNFVRNRQLSGVQLWAGKDLNFTSAYDIKGIPRFILIDPKGKIVSANAPRPSNPSLKALLNSLNL